MTINLLLPVYAYAKTGSEAPLEIRLVYLGNKAIYLIFNVYCV